MITIFAASMLAGKSPVIYGDGNQTRDFVFIDDVAHAFVQAMDRGSGKLVNIGTGLETSVVGLYKLLAQIIGFTDEPGHATLPPGELRRIALRHLRRLQGARVEALDTSRGRARRDRRLSEGDLMTDTSPVAELAGKFEERVAAFVKEHRLPGASAGVVVGDELVWSGGHGYADLATKRPNDPTTLFRIASITKTFTATAILQLRDEGKLHLDDPAVVYLPELRDAQSPFGRDRDGDAPPDAVARVGVDGRPTRRALVPRRL